MTDDELLTFIINGRPIGDLLNTTGVASARARRHPSLTDDQLLSITYLRSLQAGSRSLPR
ncbi:MAG: hypothetical protein U0521_13360 [Anaerolineae bacterium]